MSDQQLSDEPIVMSHLVPPTNGCWWKILHPMTIFQVLQVLQEHSSPSEDESASGEARFAIALVAHVISVEVNPAKASYVLEDGTGRIYGDKDLDSITQQLGLSVEAIKAETYQSQALEHTYVEVVAVKNPRWKHRIKIKSIQPVQGYSHVMYHVLNVIYSKMHSQKCVQDDFDQDFLPKGDDMVVDGCQHQFDVDVQHHTIHSIPASHPALSNIFSPQRHQPYATLKPLERTIMVHMHHHYRNQQVLIGELAKAIGESYGCSEQQFNIAVQTLLSEAYMTCPLDDGYVVVTPRH